MKYKFEEAIDLGYIGLPGKCLSRFVGDDGQDYWLAKEPASILDYERASDFVDICGGSSLAKHSDFQLREKAAIKISPHGAAVLSTNQLYRGLLRSNQPLALQMQEYVYHHLEQLRKHGVTGTRDYWQNELDSGDERRVLIAKLHLHDMDEMEAKLKAEKERADKAEETIKEMEDRDVKTIINDLNKKYEPKKIHKLSYSLLREYKVWDGMEINKAYSDLFETYNNQNGIRSIAYKSEKREDVKKLIDDWLTLYFVKEDLKKMILFDKES